MNDVKDYGQIRKHLTDERRICTYIIQHTQGRLDKIRENCTDDCAEELEEIKLLEIIETAYKRSLEINNLLTWKNFKQNERLNEIY